MPGVVLKQCVEENRMVDLNVIKSDTPPTPRTLMTTSSRKKLSDSTCSKTSAQDNMVNSKRPVPPKKVVSDSTLGCDSTLGWELSF